jgi:hypothetical protein
MGRRELAGSFRVSDTDGGVAGVVVVRATASQRAGSRWGASWGDIGRALKVAQNATTQQDLLDALAQQKREVWRRFWG